MRVRIALLTAAAALSAGAAQAASVEVKDAVARVTVIPENRSDIKVEVVRANGQLPLSVRSMGGRTIIDGNLDRKIRNCRGGAGKAVVRVRDVGDVGWDQMPQVVIRTPRDVDVDAEGAVWGSVGRSASLKLGNAGCGDWVIANVEGPARIGVAGSGDTRMGAAGATRISLAGSGDVATADVRGGLDVNIAGAGSVLVKSIAGPLDVSIAGSGDLAVGGGRATTMKVTVAGSGNVNFQGSADSLKARIMGSGDVRAREVRGEVTKTLMGSGNVRVGD